MVKKEKGILYVGIIIFINLLYLTGSTFLLSKEPNYLIQLCLKILGTSLSLIFIHRNIQGKKGWKIFIPMMFLFLLGDFLLAGMELIPHRALAFQIGSLAFFLCYLCLGLTLLIKGWESQRGWIAGAVFFVVLLLGYIQYKTYRISDPLLIPLVLAYLFMTALLLTGGVLYLLKNGVKGLYFFLCAFFFYLSDCIIGQHEFGGLTSLLVDYPIMLFYGLGHGALILATWKLPVLQKKNP